jgi:hypothetical protein
MGSPIRSEIWACISPGIPQLAACLAYKDAMLDHAGGEGVYGEMFWAALESAAFVISDPKTLINIGLSMIPISCQISRVTREALWCYENGLDWDKARERISVLFSNPNSYDAIPNTFGGYLHPCLSIPNQGFTLIGWLYGKDFGDKLLKAVNCGYDTDCTGATLGSLLGIIDGVGSIPEKWKKPVGENIVICKFTDISDYPKTVSELTEKTMKAAENFIKNKSNVINFGEKTEIFNNDLSILYQNEEAKKILSSYDVDSAAETVKDLEIVLHYYGDPVIYPGVEKLIGVTSTKNGKIEKTAKTEIKCPKNWKIKKLDNNKFKILSGDVESSGKIKATVSLRGEKYSADFVILSDSDTKGWPTGVNVDRCDVCGGRKGSCLCNT